MLFRSDDVAVDRALTGGPVLVGGIGGLLRRAQTGYVRSYAASILGGSLVVIVALLVVNFS